MLERKEGRKEERKEGREEGEKKGRRGERKPYIQVNSFEVLCFVLVWFGFVLFSGTTSSGKTKRN